MLPRSFRLLVACFFIGGVAGTAPQQPPELRSADGWLNVTLEVTVTRSTEGPFKFNRRSYNGLPVGPTLRVKPGDKLNILIVNHLTKDPPKKIGRYYASKMPKNWTATATGDWMHDRDVYSYPNYTNLHLHGMHVSPEGCHDNILRSCGPETNMTYEYEIPSDHPAGTFWYHPHLHGSGALQVASGMVGALIVEDKSPTMDETVLVLHEVSHSNMPFQAYNILCYFCIDNFAWPSGDRLDMKRVHDKANFPSFAKCGPPKQWPNTTRDMLQTTQPFDCTYVLVNGAFQPEVPVTVGVYQRWRLVQSSHSSAIRFVIDGACEALVIARDGRYLSTPRNVTGKPVVVTAGSRADFAIRCLASGTFPITSLPGGIHKSLLFKGSTELYEPVLFPGAVLATIRATTKAQRSGAAAAAATAAAQADLVSKLPPGSFQERDLLAKPVDRKFKVVYNLTGQGLEGGAVHFPGIVANGGTFSINGKSYTNRTEHCMVKGEVEEWTVLNAANVADRWMHSFHIHQSWFQIVGQTVGEDGQLVVEDMQPGDWRDTVQVPVNGTVTLRLQMNFVGTLPFHCHVGAHQDIGMMQLVQIVQDEKQCPPGTLSPRESPDVLV